MKNDELFTLIKSMDRNERGYFKKFSSLHGHKSESKYLKLFNCLAAMEEYDEERLRQLLKGEKFLRQLGVAKLYLRNMIVKALRNYGDADGEMALLNGLAEVELLHRRQLYESAGRLATKLQQYTSEYERFLFSAYLSVVQISLATSKNSLDGLNEKNAAALECDTENLRRYLNLRQYINLNIEVQSALQHGGTAKGALDDTAIKALKNPLLHQKNQALSIRAECMRRKTLVQVYAKLNMHDEALEAARDYLALFTEKPGAIKIYAPSYLEALTLLVTRYTYLLKHKEALEVLDQTEALLKNPLFAPDPNIKFHTIIYILAQRVTLYTRTGQYARALETKHKYDLEIKKNLQPGKAAIITEYYKAWCLMATGQQTAALHTVNNLIHGTPDPDNRRDVLAHLHYMSTVIHFGLGNFSLMKRLFTVWEDFMETSGFASSGWNEYMKIFKRIIKAQSAGNKKLLVSYLNELLANVTKYEFIEPTFTQWWIGQYLAGMKGK